MLRYLREREIHPSPKRVRTLTSLPRDTVTFSHGGHLDPYPEHPEEYKLLSLKRRSKIQEILVLSDTLLVTLQASGISCVFKKAEKNGRLNFEQHGYLNHEPDEIIRSLFHNKVLNAVVIVSVYPGDKKARLRCRSISIADIEEGNMGASKKILENEVLGFPGWIELCEVNSKILTLTSNADSKTFKVWDLAENYPLMYEIKPAEGERLADVKASPSFLLLVYEPVITGPGRTSQRISLLDIRDGKEVFTLRHPLRSKLEVIEQFCDSILIKEKYCDLVIYNVRWANERCKKVSMPNGKLNAFSFLHSTRVFLTFQTGGRVATYDHNGSELAVVFNEEPLVGSTRSLPGYGIVLVARDQETLISVRSCCDADTGARAAVEFRKVMTGELLCRIPLPHLTIHDISSICYDEEKLLLLIGTRDGLIHVYN